MASGPGLAPLAPSPQSASHPTEVGFNCELGGRRTCVHLHLHLHLHVTSFFWSSSPSPCLHLHLQVIITFIVTFIFTLASPSVSFIGSWWACWPPGPRFPTPSLLFSSHYLHLLLSSMSLHLHSHLHLHSLPPVLCGQAGHQGHGFLQLHFSSSSLSPYGSPCSWRHSPSKPRLPTMWVLIAELGVDERVSGTPFTSQLFPAVHAAVVIPPVSLGSPQCGF